MLTLDEGADRVVRASAIRPGDRVLVVYDRRSNAGPAWAIRRAATAAGANAHVRFLDTERAAPDADVLTEVAAELADIDVVVVFTRTSVLFSSTADAIVRRGGRLITMIGADEAMLTSGAIEADFDTLAPVADRFAARLGDASHAELTSECGTRLSMDLTGRPGIGCPPSGRRPGIFRFPYAGAVAAPIEGSASGVVVVDVSTSFGLVDAPITFAVENGRVVAVSGGAAATRVEDALARSGDPRMGVVAVVGFGINPAAKPVGVISTDAAAAGTGHLCLGANLGIGGANAARGYLECVLDRPTLLLDGVDVIHAGEPVGLEKPLP